MRQSPLATGAYAVATLAFVLWIAFGLTHAGQVKSAPLLIVAGGLMAVFMAWTWDLLKGRVRNPS